MEKSEEQSQQKIEEQPIVEKTQEQLAMQKLKEQFYAAKEKTYCYGSAETDQFKCRQGQFEAPSPVAIPFFAQNSIRVSKIFCGSMHNLLISNYGKVYSWGCNDDYALGREGQQNVPNLVNLPIPVDMITAGDSHSLFCNSTNGIIYMCGVYRNIFKGNMTDQVKIPVRFGEKAFRYKKIDKILSGANHSFVLSDGRVYAWGDPEVGVLGRKASCRRKYKMGLTVMQIPAKKVHDIFTGYTSAFYTKYKGDKQQVFSWGLNKDGQLGIGQTVQDMVITPQQIKGLEGKEIVDIQGGSFHSLFLTKEGEVYGCGKNDAGQLGIGEIVPHYKREEVAKQVEEMKPEEVGLKRLLLKSFIDSPIKIPGLKNVEKIFSNEGYSYARTNSNELYSWGTPENYVLGNKDDMEDQPTPFHVTKQFLRNQDLASISLGSGHVFVVTSESKKLCPFDKSVTQVLEQYQKRKRIKQPKSKINKQLQKQEQIQIQKRKLNEVDMEVEQNQKLVDQRIKKMDLEKTQQQEDK